MIHITKHSGKMEQFSSISTNNLSNDFCKKMHKNKKIICSKCYANRLLDIRTSLKDHLESNSQALSRKIITKQDVPILNSLYFRFNSFGELINKKHFKNLVKICKLNPRTTFTLWTKRVNLVDLTIKPDNMILIYSNPILNDISKKTVPFGFDKIFNVYSKKVITERDIKVNCKKSCINCLKCYTKNRTKIINERVK